MSVSAQSTAAELDAADPLAHLRDRFELPEGIYLVGNSLGALPRSARANVLAELDRWSTLGVEGHFTGHLAWKDYHQLVADQLARLVGASADEVVAMNALTVNLHLLMISFYTPTPERHKVLIESHAFPSDHFAVESQIRQRGFDPAESLITLMPREGEETLRSEDIVATIQTHGPELALVLLPGVQYYTGQVLPMAEITAAAHAAGAMVGFDLAHAVANIELQLHFAIDYNIAQAWWVKPFLKLCNFLPLDPTHHVAGGKIRAAYRYIRLCRLAASRPERGQKLPAVFFLRVVKDCFLAFMELYFSFHYCILKNLLQRGTCSWFE